MSMFKEEITAQDAKDSLDDYFKFALIGSTRKKCFTEFKMTLEQEK